MKNPSILFVFAFLVLFSFCKSKQAATGRSQSTVQGASGTLQSTESSTNTSQSAEPAVIYKTKADYSKNVPVTLNPTMTAIVAYPTPKDIYYKGKLAYPVKLDNGYYLDNRGVGSSTAFLKLTYEQYSNLTEAPPMAEMMNMIIDKEPVTELYILGPRSQFKNEVEDINKLINNDGLKNFQRIK